MPWTIEQADAARLPLGDAMIQVMVTSPPYGLGKDYDVYDDDQGYAQYLELARIWAAELFRVSRPQARLCVNVPLDISRGGEQALYADWLAVLKSTDWTYRTCIAWLEAPRGNVGKSTARGSIDSPSAPRVTAPIEMIIVCSKGEWNLHRADASDLSHAEWLDWTNGVWIFAAEQPARVNHPAPFPEELPRRLIKLFHFLATPCSIRLLALGRRRSSPGVLADRRTATTSPPSTSPTHALGCSAKPPESARERVHSAHSHSMWRFRCVSKHHPHPDEPDEPFYPEIMLRLVPLPLLPDFLHQLGCDRAVADVGPLHADDECQPRRFVARYWDSEANQLGSSDGLRGGAGQLDGQAWLAWLHGGGFLGPVGAWLVEHEVRLDRAPGAPRIQGSQLPYTLDDLAHDLTLAARLGCPLPTRDHAPATVRVVCG